MSRSKLTGVGIAVLAAVFCGIPALAMAEVPAKPTFSKDILPILQENCQECHRPGTVGTSGLVAPMSLMSYKEVRPWSKAIAKAVQDEYMPPWFASRDFHGVFRNERSLTQEEIDTVVRWAEIGAPRGNPSDAPDPIDFPEEAWWLGEPDLVVPLPEPIWVGDEIEDWQPNIPIKLTEEQLPEDRWIRTLECQPGSEVVHHIVVYTQYDDPPAGQSRAASFGGGNIGGLAPGAEPSLVQEGYGIPLRKGATLNVSMHYHKESGPGTGSWDQSKIGFFFYPKDAEVKPIHIEPIGSLDFEIPPNTADWRVGMATTFNKPFTILNYLPHMHLRGAAAKYTAHYPDGSSEVLLDVPRYDYNWQLYYEYPEPKSFPAGTRVEVEMTFDNSIENPTNPDPNKAIRFGAETTDEMALGWMYYAWDTDPALTAGAATD